MFFCCLAYILISFMPKDLRPPALGMVIPANALVIGAFVFGGIAHSTVIMRPSSEPSPLHQELLHKFPLVALSSVLTFLLTLLGLYLKHKYWP